MLCALRDLGFLYPGVSPELSSVPTLECWSKGPMVLSWIGVKPTVWWAGAGSPADYQKFPIEVPHGG